jgi:hypothetical protein
MKFLSATASLAAAIAMSQAAHGWPAYDSDVNKWIEIQPPTKSAEHQIWYYAADYCQFSWLVAREDRIVRAKLTDNGQDRRSLDHPRFQTKAEHFSGGYAFQRVEDGWLVGFNEGEFGAALYWFSHDGRTKYKISDHQVESFMVTPKGIIAIEGLAHMVPLGSLIRLNRNPKTQRWIATELKRFSGAPEAIIRLSDGRFIVAVSDSLVELTPDFKMKTLIKSANWITHVYSMVASADESKIYVGVTQYVCEYDFGRGKLRYLVPDRKFLNKLSKKEEDQLRRTYRE